MQKPLVYIGVIIIALIFASVSFAQEGFTATPSGLMYRDIEVGTGESVEVGNVAVIHFTGWLDDQGTKGKEFFNSRDRGNLIAFKVGTDRVMQGWNIGVVGMQVGGKRRLMIPAKLGYGAKGVEEVVPPNADLIFEIELLEIR